MGLKRAVNGIAYVIDLLREGSAKIPEVKTWLIVRLEDDDFRVQNVSDDYVFYYYSYRGDHYQFALEREKGGFYNDGAELADGGYVVTGTKRFTTVLGTGKEVLILKHVW